MHDTHPDLALLSVGTPTVGSVKPYENLVTFEAMLIGYTEAIDRFDAAASQNNPVGTYTALFEALNWAVALDDRTKPHPASEKFYREQMEDRPVRLYLDVLGGVFLTLQHLLEPYTIRDAGSPLDNYPFPEEEAGVLSQ